MSSKKLKFIDYNERSVVISGDTDTYEDLIISIGGKFAKRLTTGPGYIFYKKDAKKVKDFVDKVNNGDIQNIPVIDKKSSNNDYVTRKEYLQLVTQFHDLQNIVKSLLKNNVKLKEEEDSNDSDSEISESEIDNKSLLHSQRNINKKQPNESKSLNKNTKNPKSLLHSKRTETNE